MVPSALTTGSPHFNNTGQPADTQRAAAYQDKYGDFMDEIRPRLAALAPPDSDVAQVAHEIARRVDLPTQQRPIRTHIDPNRNGSEVVSAVADRIRADFYHRVGIADLLPPNSSL